MNICFIMHTLVRFFIESNNMMIDDDVSLLQHANRWQQTQLQHQGCYGTGNNEETCHRIKCSNQYIRMQGRFKIVSCHLPLPARQLP